MKNIIPDTVFQGSHPKLVELYVLGNSIQWLNNGYWVDIPKYISDDGNLYRVTNDKYTFRVKPSCSYVFFHTNDHFKVSADTFTIIKPMVFPYPLFEPSGPYIMFKVDSEGKVLDSYSSTTKDVYNDDTFFKYN